MEDKNGIITIKNIENYNLKMDGKNLILTPKIIRINEYKFLNKCLKFSKILFCKVKTQENRIITTRTKYKRILNDIWCDMDFQKFTKTTLFNFKIGNQHYKNGFQYIEKLNISTQTKDNNGCKQELINMIKVNNLKIKLKIKLHDNSIILFKNF